MAIPIIEMFHVFEVLLAQTSRKATAQVTISPYRVVKPRNLSEVHRVGLDPEGGSHLLQEGGVREDHLVVIRHLQTDILFSLFRSVGALL